MGEQESFAFFVRFFFNIYILYVKYVFHFYINLKKRYLKTGDEQSN